MKFVFAEWIGLKVSWLLRIIVICHQKIIMEAIQYKIIITISFKFAYKNVWLYNLANINCLFVHFLLRLTKKLLDIQLYIFQEDWNSDY